MDSANEGTVVITFERDSLNQLLINPRLPEDEKAVLQELKQGFEKQFGQWNFFLVPSSGSSKSPGQSVKLMALSVESVLNSARRVNFYLNAKKENTWGLCLPRFHVAGLGVLARAYLTGAAIKDFSFSTQDFAKNLADNDISFLSLVPAQIYDLVIAGIRAPACVKKVFVGGGVLNEDLRRRIKDLGWPVTETYGMTETCSMVALREFKDTYFALMPGVSAKVVDEVLTLKCDSLLTAIVQKTGDDIAITDIVRNGWLHTEDLATIHEKENGSYLELHGRKADYVKILGEGVSLSELRAKLQSIGQQQGLDPRQFELVAVEHERAGCQLVLVVEESMAQQQQILINLFNQACRPYEKISKALVLRQIPRSDLGKLKISELKHIIKEHEQA